jgi:hypothetical protein
MSIVPRRFSDLSLSLSNRRHTVPSKTGILLIGIAIVLNIQELTPAKIMLFSQPVKCLRLFSILPDILPPCQTMTYNDIYSHHFENQLFALFFDILLGRKTNYSL